MVLLETIIGRNHCTHMIVYLTVSQNKMDKKARLSILVSLVLKLEICQKEQKKFVERTLLRSKIVMYFSISQKNKPQL
jgi:hypothetical protein